MSNRRCNEEHISPTVRDLPVCIRDAGIMRLDERIHLRKKITSERLKRVPPSSKK
jgi:hypothetical protein